MTSPFSMIDLPSGRWSVSWTDQLTTNKFRLMPGGEQVLNIIFGEMRLFEINIGILTRNRELETVRIYAEEYYLNNSRTVDFLSLYIVAGVIFDTETQAQQFLQIAEKYHIMKLLKEPV